MTSLLAISEFVGPGFDFRFALAVALIVAIAVMAVVVIAMTAGASAPAVIGLLGAGGKVLTAVATIALTVGTIAGVTSGWMHQAEAKEPPPPTTLQALNQLDVAFEPNPTDPKHAKDFTAIIVCYAEKGDELSAERKVITAERSDSFYYQVESQLDRWLNQRTAADGHGRPRKVCVYMSPFPGDGVYERIKQLCDRRGSVIVSRVEGPWTSAATP